jgi:hypothetical protein
VRETPSFKHARMRFKNLNFVGCFARLFFRENFTQRRSHGFVQIFVEFPVFFGGFL